jgi:hypothetical protein
MYPGCRSNESTIISCKICSCEQAYHTRDIVRQYLAAPWQVSDGHMKDTMRCTSVRLTASSGTQQGIVRRLTFFEAPQVTLRSSILSSAHLLHCYIQCAHTYPCSEHSGSTHVSDHPLSDKLITAILGLLILTLRILLLLPLTVSY